MTENPVLIEITRGNLVESVHRGAACVVDASGNVLHQWGAITQAICPRSAIKPFQSIPLLESGAADAAGLSAEDLSLACASHSGEPIHVKRVSAWLERITCTPADLECGTHAPTSPDAAAALIRADETPCPLHHNCSGKHTGFLTLARHLGIATRGYTDMNHPVQTLTLDALSKMAGEAADTWPVVRDGCSAANVFLPLRALALAWARLGTTPASARLIAAMKAHPILMSGEGRPCATMIEALKGEAVVKTGAEGVFAAVLPERGLGIAVKIDDGATRASTAAIAHLLAWLDGFRPDAMTAVDTLRFAEITAAAGGTTGRVQPARAWLT